MRWTMKLTHKQIDALSGRELEAAVRARLAERSPLKIDLFLNDTDATLALLAENPRGCDMRVRTRKGVTYIITIRAKHGWNDVRATGDTLAEAGLRCWLKWELAQGEADGS